MHACRSRPSTFAVHSTGAVVPPTNGLRVALDLTSLDAADVRLWFVEQLLRLAEGVEFVLLGSHATQHQVQRLQARSVCSLTLPDPSPLQAIVARVDARLPAARRRRRLVRRLDPSARVERALSRARTGVLAGARA